MLVVYGKCSFEKVFACASAVVVGIWALVLLFFLTTCVLEIFSSHFSSQIAQPFYRKKKGLFFVQEVARPKKEPYAYHLIGTGPFSLRIAPFEQCICNLKKELVLLAKGSRPGLQKGEETFLLQMKNTQERLCVRQGVPFFLEESSSLKGESPLFSFSQQSGALWGKVMLLEEGVVLIEVGGMFAGKEERAQWILEKGEKSFGDKTDRAVSFLQGARVWGKDLLLTQYGGKEYQSLKDRLQLECSSSSYFCYVKAGDYLSWTGERWEGVILEKAPVDQPLAWVRSVDQARVSIEIWLTGEAEFFPIEIQLELSSQERMRALPETLISSLRLKNQTSCTALLGKQRLLLKKGDWLLKQPLGWRRLRTLEEIESAIQHRIRGELLVVDEIVKEKGFSSPLLKGHLFNEMRTEMTPFSLPIGKEKKERRKKQARELSPLLAARSL